MQLKNKAIHTEHEHMIGGKLVIHVKAKVISLRTHIDTTM